MQGPVSSIKPYVDEFIAFARKHPEYEFIVTRIGCGIAGFSDADILENMAVCQKLSIIKRFFATIISHKFCIMEKMNANFFQEMMEELRVQARLDAINSIVDPDEHMDAVEIHTHVYMLGARMAFNMIASKLFTSDEIEMDMSAFDDATEDQMSMFVAGDKKLLN